MLLAIRLLPSIIAACVGCLTSGFPDSSSFLPFKIVLLSL